MFIALSSTCIRKVHIRHALLCLLSHSVAVAAWSDGIFFQSCKLEPSFQILHGFRSWVFIDNVIHYALTILHRVDISGIWGPAQISSITFGRVFLHHAWVASRGGGGVLP